MSENGTAEQMQKPKHGEFCWTEIATTNLEACRKFYTEIFGWKFEESDATAMQYQEFGLAGGDIHGACSFGGMYEMNEEMCGGTIPPAHFVSYIAVDDCDEAASKAFELGGKIVMPPMDIPNVGRFCAVEDPTGARFSMITLKNPGGEK